MIIPEQRKLLDLYMLLSEANTLRPDLVWAVVYGSIVGSSFKKENNKLVGTEDVVIRISLSALCR